MRKLFFTVTITILLSSCLSLNQFVVTPLGEEPAGYSQRFVYSLPQTVFMVRMELLKTTYLPGPYRKFSEKYLGIPSYINEESTEWEINGVEVSEFAEPDADQYYSVNLLRGSFKNSDYFRLTGEGLVIDPMGMISANTEQNVYRQMEIPSILELSMKKNHKIVIDTLYKTVIKDSSFVKIPIFREQKEAKTLEQKAEEAADLIIKIRKRRLKLMTGEYDIFPEGKALEFAVKELEMTERDYVALFTGREVCETFTQSYLIVPSGNREKIVVTKFSGKSGIISVESNEGEPVTLEVNPVTGFPLGIRDNEKESKNTLFYRIPSACIIKVTTSDEMLFDGRFSIYQAGSIFTLPLNKKVK